MGFPFGDMVINVIRDGRSRTVATVTTIHTPASARPAPIKPTSDKRAGGKGIRLFAHDMVNGPAELRNIGPKQAATLCQVAPGGSCGCGCSGAR